MHTILQIFAVFTKVVCSVTLLITVLLNTVNCQVTVLNELPQLDGCNPRSDYHISISDNYDDVHKVTDD